MFYFLPFYQGTIFYLFTRNIFQYYDKNIYQMKTYLKMGQPIILAG